jgi:geranylgeranyl diphosphate synthase, type II
MSLQYERYVHLKSLIDVRLATIIERDKPETMYTPARYVLEAGGKRIRPVLILLACEAVGGVLEHAVDAGVAVEILHNFTLVHDDIMDNADQRRGRATVHKKWDTNVAILVGDELIGIAYKCLLGTPDGDIREIIDVFTDGMMEVCEGQSYDKEFEGQVCVTEADYLMMVGKKTGELVKMSAELGAIIGGATAAQRAALISYAAHVGRAFQIQDDLLDVVADEKEFGKVIGGDIIEGKKTYLLVKALGLASGADLEVLMHVAAKEEARPGLVAAVTDIYDRLGVLRIAREQIRRDTDDAIAALAALDATPGRDMLIWFAEMLLRRNF